jgi:hypothetical protein
VTLTVTAPNNPPTVATPASASPNPVSGKTTALSVLGADDGGEANLVYTWSTGATPPAPVTFSINGTNAAKYTTATFSKAGAYTLVATIKDTGGLTVTSSVAVTVSQTLTAITVSPASVTVNIGAAQQFTASAKDQFGNALSPQPAITWGVSGGGTISASGLFTAGASPGGPFTVTASSGSTSGTANVTILNNTNIALNGTAYRWFAMASATSNTNKTAAPALNDNDLTTDVPLTGAGDDVANAFEAGGIIWTSTQSVAKVVFINGSFNSATYDGVFDNSFALQTTTNGSTWTAVSGWTLSPAYAYNVASAANKSYAFTGPALTVLGVRVVGRVHSRSGNDSWYDNCTEVQAFSSSTAAPAMIASSPAATPNPALAGQPVTLTAAADSAQTYSWDFGDGNSGDGSSATHTFVAPGTYSATVNISDASGQTNSAFVTVAVVANNPLKVTAFLALIHAMPSAKDVSAPSTKDVYAIKAELAGFSNAANLAGENVTLNVAGASTTFKLDAHGKGVAPNAQCTLKVSKGKAVFSAKVTGSGLAGTWGITPSVSTETLTVALDIGNTSYSGQITATQKSTRGAIVLKSH